MKHSVEPSSQRDEGYVLLEMLVAVVVFALAAYIVAPHISRRTGNRDLQTAAVLLVSELRAAQASAIKASRAESVALDVRQHRLVWGAPARVVALPASVSMSVDATPRRDTPSTAPNVHFHHDGSSNGAKIVLRSSGMTSTVVVDWLTGQTRIAARNLHHAR